MRNVQASCTHARILPGGGLLDERRLHPVADAALQLMVMVMMVTDNRLLFQILHRRTAHVQRLL